MLRRETPDRADTVEVRHPQVHQPTVFAITGMIHSAGLRPWPLVYLGAVTSGLILYFVWGGLPTTARDASVFVAILAVQTVLIGTGFVGADRLTVISEERRRSLVSLEAARSENEALQAQLVEQARDAGIGEERARLAREIHDTIAQGLVGVVTQLEAARQLEHDPATDRHLENAAWLARDTLAEARRSVQALAPRALERGRLPDAIDELVRDWSTRHDIPVVLQLPDGPLVLPLPAEVALLRVTQEALTQRGQARSGDPGERRPVRPR
jgi:signal transduction histidine kinase